MTKNVNVIDEKGNHISFTYPKRAKGLVKKGRAHFVNEDTVCLLHPPDKNYSEEIIMEENLAIENANIPKTASSESENNDLTVKYILDKIDVIMRDTNHIQSALATLTAMDDGDNGDCGSPGNILGQAKAQAVADTVKCRETTNQKLLDIYMRMYEDIKPVKQNSIIHVIDSEVAQGFANAVENLSAVALQHPESQKESLSAIDDILRNIGRLNIPPSSNE